MRLFVAVEIPPSVRAAVDAAVAPVRAAAPGLRWVAPERYHLTLVFLGAVEEELVTALGETVREACHGMQAFELSLDGTVGTFGRRVLWAGLRDSPQLVELASRVTAAVRRVVALPDEDRAFSAHLTLARAGREKVRSALLDAVAVPPVAWTVDRVVLMKSAGGYQVVDGAALGA